jgi:uncharacterized protein YegJ (DUF2314 family)
MWQVAAMTFAFSMRVKCAVLAAVLVMMGVPLSDARAEDHSPVIDVPSSDAEMAGAIAKARATLPTFWASYEAPKPSETGHSLKVRFPAGRNRGEHIWMMDVKRLPDGGFSGRFGNAPRDLPGKREGDLAEFRDADITDWMFMRNGKIVGCETMKPLLKSMSKADAAAFRARMETP